LCDEVQRHKHRNKDEKSKNNALHGLPVLSVARNYKGW
jgi:hypothetical protein